jgi:hypothetical protein
LGTTIVSTPMVIMIALSDWVTYILVGCLKVSTIVTFDTFNEVKLTQVWRCSILWLPMGIFYGAKCGCEYTFGSLFLN